MNVLKILTLLIISTIANAEVTYTNGLDKRVSNVSMNAGMRNGSLNINFYYQDNNGQVVLWTGKAMTQCAVYENNGDMRNPSMGNKRAWTGNIKLKSYSQDVIMNNIYLGDYQTNTAVLQCYIELKNYSRNLRTVFVLHGI